MHNQTEIQELRVVSPRTVAQTAGMSVRTIQRKCRKREFPAPVRLSEGRIGFYEHEVQAWLAALPRTREAA
jgi:predicted DNA-binding transcriptional regulator AlpA